MPGRRAASMDLPDPGAPTNSTWWRPAAAISNARLAFSCPFTSRRSRPWKGWLTSPAVAGDRTAAPVKCRIASCREFAPITRQASTHAASGPQALGQTRSRLCSAAAIAAGRAPSTGTKVPSNDNSPKETVPATTSLGMISSAAKRLSAMGRSKCDPSLGKSAGDRLIVMRFDGRAMDREESADRTRSRASDTALSGRPTMEKAGRPGLTAHCTSTERASTPSNATE